MDDVLPGVIIDAILGIDMNVTDEFKSQVDSIFGGNSSEVNEQAQVGCIVAIIRCQYLLHTACIWSFTSA